MISNLDRHQGDVLRYKEMDYSNVRIAEVYGTSEGSVRRALARWDKEPEGAEPIEIEISGDDTRVDELLKFQGIDKDEFEITGFETSAWGNEENPNSSLRIKGARRIAAPLILPPVDQYVAPSNTASVREDGSQFVVVVSDHHVPFNDKRLHELSLAFIQHNNPDRLVVNGDLADFDSISRFRNNPEHQSKVQECVNGSYSILRDYRLADENMAIDFLLGNHEIRLQHTLLDYAKGLYELRPADEPGEPQEYPVWDFRNLFRLDKLGINYAPPVHGQYANAQVKLTDKLAVRHGWIVKSGSGASALGTLNHLGYNIIVGHTHRLAIVEYTRQDIDGNPIRLVAGEGGCMCEIENGLGHAIAPDWQPGFLTVQIWPDGYFHIERAVYTNGVLLWGNQRFE